MCSFSLSWRTACIKPGKPLLPATEYQGDYMLLEVIGRILPLLHGVVYYEEWTPFPIMGTTEILLLQPLIGQGLRKIID